MSLPLAMTVGRLPGDGCFAPNDSAAPRGPAAATLAWPTGEFLMSKWRQRCPAPITTAIKFSGLVA